MIGGSQEDDYATVYKNNRGFHMVNQHVKTTFDCITNDSSLGVTPPTTRWIGRYSNWGSNVFNEDGGDSLSGQDSGMAYSWHFQLHPESCPLKEYIVLCIGIRSGFNGR